MLQKKQIFKINTLKKLLIEENSCVSLVGVNKLLALPPCFLNDIKKGIFFLLNNALKKYDHTLDGILIGYQNVKILMDERTGIIPMGVAEIRVNISVEFYVFQPKIGGFLKGFINKKSKYHIGCLVHKYFNATILKPENLDYEAWSCKDFNVGDEIKFQVVDLDFSGLLPRIEGVMDDPRLFKHNDLSKASSNITSENNNYEKMLLESDEFWKEKLTQNNLTLPLNNESLLEKEEILNEKNKSVNQGDPNVSKEEYYSPKKKKRKKDKEKNQDCFLETSFTENEELKEENVFSSTKLDSSQELNIDIYSPICIPSSSKITNTKHKKKEKKQNLRLEIDNDISKVNTKKQIISKNMVKNLAYNSNKKNNKKSVEENGVVKSKYKHKKKKKNSDVNDINSLYLQLLQNARNSINLVDNEIPVTSTSASDEKSDEGSNKSKKNLISKKYKNESKNTSLRRESFSEVSTKEDKRASKKRKNT